MVDNCQGRIPHARSVNAKSRKDHDLLRHMYTLASSALSFTDVQEITEKFTQDLEQSKNKFDLLRYQYVADHTRPIDRRVKFAVSTLARTALDRGVYISVLTRHSCSDHV